MLWNEKGEAYQVGDRIISIEQAEREGKIVERPFENDGTGYIRDGRIYPRKKDAGK